MSFLNQKNLIYLTVAAAPLYLIRFTILKIPTNLLELLMIITISLWAWNKIWREKKSNLKLPPWPLMLGICMIVTGVIFSIFTNDSILIGLGILKSWFAVPLIFAYIVYDTLENRYEIEKTFSAIYCSGSIVAIIAIIYKSFGIVTFDNRLSAFYLSPNFLSLYLAPSALIGCYFFIQTVKNGSRLLIMTMGISLLSIFGAIFYSYSYACWIAVLISLSITSFHYFQKKHFLAILLCLISMFSFMVLSQIHSQKLSSLANLNERSSLASRVMIWKASEKMLSEKPLAGIGPGNFQKKYLSLQPLFPPYLEWAVPQPHNIFLAFWLQSGILGFFGFIILLSFIFYSLLKKNESDLINLEMLPFSFFIYLIFHGLLDTPFWKNDLSFLFWINISLFALIINCKKSNSQKKIKTFPQN